MADVLRADIVGRDMGASAALRGYSREAGVAAETVRRLAEAQDAQRRAAATSAAATIASAKADRILKDASDDAIRATVEQRIATEKLAKSSKDAAGAGGIGALAGLGGAGGGGMAAVAIAAAGLSPVIATLGVGLGGLALAAVGAGKRSQQLKAELAPLRAQFVSFSKSLQPTLLRDFAAGARLAGHVLADIRPVTVATGKALEQMLFSVDKEFQSGQWQSFFRWMAQQAGPDVRLLTQDFTDLANLLPPLLRDLQPVGRGILVVGDDAARAAHGVVSFYDSFQKNVPISTEHTFGFLRDLDKWTVDLTNHIPGAHAINNWLSSLQGDANGAATAQRQLSGATRNTDLTLAQQVKQLNIAAGAYERAIGPLDNYINATITEYNDLHSLRQALKTSGDTIGYKTQKERNSFAAAQAYIDQTLKQGNAALAAHKGIDAQITSIEKALPVLEHVKGKTADYRAELDLLKKILDKLRAERSITETVKVFGRGRWQVDGTVHGIGGHTGAPMAAGGRVRGGVPGQDSVLILAQQDEAVLSTAHTRALAPLLRQIGVPGFAGGGLVGSYGGGVAGLPPWTSHNQAATVTMLTDAIARSFASSFAQSMSVPGGGGGFGASALVAQAFARSLFPAHGWSMAQWPFLLALWNQESGWNSSARNPSSGAAGIPQDITGNFHGGYKGQVIWGENYIAGRYVTPAGAWAHEKAFNWYGGGLRGGIFRQPTPIVVGDGGPERVDVTPLGRTAHGGALVHVDTMVVQDATDMDLVSARLNWLITSASLGT